MNPYSVSKKQQYFQDLATTLSQSDSQANQRVQIKMPAKVVTELDRLYPDINRSQLFTQLALEAINHKLRFADRPVFVSLQADEQSGLDTMHDYLSERDQDGDTTKIR